jgi:autotransporter-associated beta strand protein
MKIRNSNLFRSRTIATAFSVALFSHFAATSASALTAYWDGDGSTTGFGTAAGTWSSTGTLWDDTQGWSSSALGTAAPTNTNYTTTTSDILNFGSATGGPLAAGTITVSGSVNSANMTIPAPTSTNGNNLTLSGGTINFGGTTVITATATSTALSYHTISSVISGAATSLSVINGFNEMTFSNTANTYSGKTISQGGWLNVAKIGTTGNSSSLGTNGVIQLGASGTSNGQLKLIGVGETTNKQIALGNNSGTNASGGLISNNSSDAAALTFSNATFNIAQSGITGAVTRKVTFRGTSAINVAGVIQNNSATGLVSVSKVETNTVTLSGANTYTGSTTIDAGVLSVGTISNGGVASGLGKSTNAAANLLFTNNSTLRYTGTTASTDRNFTISSGKTAILDVTSAATALTISGASTGATGAITKIGAGTLILTGANTHTGGTTIQDGTLHLSGGNNAPGLFKLEGSSTAPILKLSNVNALATTATLLGSNGSANTGTLDLAAAGSYSLAAYTGQNMKFTASSGSATTLTFTGDSAISSGSNGSKTFNNNDANLTIAFSGALDIGSSSANSITITGAGNTSVAGAVTSTGSAIRGLDKSGSGTLTLSGANNFTGATNVNGGKLVINGASVSSLTTVSTGAIIGGSGTVGALTIAAGGYHNPGNSPGIMSTGNYTNAGTLNIEVIGATAGVTGYDQVNVTGSVDITGGTLTTAFTAGSYSMGSFLFILLNDGSDAITGTFSGLAQGATVTTYGGFDWLINYTADSTTNSATGGNDIALLAVPEPNAAMLVGGLGMLALLRRRRNG